MLIRQLWYILTPRERIEGAFLMCAMVVGAAFEAVSIGLVVPFIGVLKQPELLVKVEYFRPFLSKLNINEPQQLFFVLGPAMIALFAIKTGYLLKLYLWLFSYAMKKHVSLARQLMTGYLTAPYTLHLQRNSAELIRVVTRSVEDFTNGFMVNLLIAMGELLVLAALTALLMFVEPLVTVGALLVLAVPTALV
jgi:ATP-binding cassette, subfamily B, bacterial PglK